MQAHYSYLDHFLPHSTAHDIDVQRFLAGIILCISLVLIAKLLTGRISKVEGVKSHVIPGKKLSWFGFFDLFAESFIKYHDSVLGKENRKHIPFTGSFFLFIFVANLIGLIPGMPVVTNTVWLNVGMALVVFYYFNMFGVLVNGGGYFKHLLGPMMLIAPFYFLLEVLSICIRVFTLNLRLYWNIKADHIVLDTFTNILPPFLGFPFYFIGTFVSFMQAFVFTTLTMIYILLAVEHEEEH